MNLILFNESSTLRYSGNHVQNRILHIVPDYRREMGISLNLKENFQRGAAAASVNRNFFRMPVARSLQRHTPPRYPSSIYLVVNRFFFRRSFRDPQPHFILLSKVLFQRSSFILSSSLLLPFRTADPDGAHVFFTRRSRA